MPAFNGITNNTSQNITYDAIKIGLASPEKILEWSPACLTRNILDS